MSVLLEKIWTGYYELFEANGDPRVKNLPLMGSPLPALCIIFAYHYFVNHYGPRMMEKRPAFDLYYPMILYNFVQIAVNSWFVYMAFSWVWIPRRYNLICEPVDYSNSFTGVLVSWYAWLYFMVKVLDLLDTVFIVLRKKNKQNSFLHRYHHIGMVVAGWMCTKYVPGGHAVFFGTVNCIVHAVMYSYYQIVLVWPEFKKNLWWKKRITQLQMVQFVVTSLHATAALLTPNCGFNKYLLGIFIPQDVFMFFLFLDFYRKAYKSRKTKDKES